MTTTLKRWVRDCLLPVFLLAALTTTMTLLAIVRWELQEERRLRETLVDQAVKWADVFHAESHVGTNSVRLP